MRYIVAYRILSSENDSLAATPAVFAPYVTGTVGYYGDPWTPKAERVNEGSPFSPDTPRIFFSPAPTQSCPGMIGPIGEGEYYCRGREYGYCDRRTGLCVCNDGYTGQDCTECQSSYFRKGSLCFPKQRCPKDCSRAGVCDYETGTCTCAMHRHGEDCAQIYCAHFDEKCTSCTASTCLSCIEGFSVDPIQQTCVRCSRFDPRCLICDANQCLACADLLLNSVQRSGARDRDEPLPDDERQREYSFQFSYGSQNPLVFAEVEPFEVIPSATRSGKFLNDTSRACIQGQQDDANWTCTPIPITHRVCGHVGVFTLSSPIYAITENAGFIVLTVRRSGGGVGTATIMYELQHRTTTASDVSPTAPYTTSTKLTFDQGVIELSFRLTIHDNHVVDGNRTFRVLLREPSDGTSLGNQREALITIVDDDNERAIDAELTHVQPSTSARPSFWNTRAGDVMSFVVQAVQGNGAAKTTGGDVFVIESAIEGGSSVTQWAERVRQRGTVADMHDGTYSCSWQREHTGNYTLSVLVLSPGGLRGEYFADAWLGQAQVDGNAKAPPIVSRIDRHLNFTWTDEISALVAGARAFASVRWTGRLLSKTTGDVTFITTFDDHVRVWIDDVLIIDRWARSSDGGETVQATMTLMTGVFYALVVEYRQITSAAQLHLAWRGADFAQEIIPMANLFSTQHIVGSPWMSIPIRAAMTPSPDTSLLQGRLQAIAGAILELRIVPKDVYGNAQTMVEAPSDAFAAALTLTTDQSLGGIGPTRVECDIQWRSTQHERAQALKMRCAPIRSGIYMLDVRVQGVAMLGSPFSVMVIPDRMLPTQSVLSGSGLLNQRIAGQATVIQVEARDAYHNRLLSSSPEMSAGLSLHAFHTTQLSIIEQGSVQDQQDGTFLITYTPRRVGTYRVHVMFGGMEFQTSPVLVSVVPNAAIGATSIATGSGLSTASTNVQATFRVQTRDLQANDVLSGGAVLRVVLEHPAWGNLTGACVDSLNGAYSCAYTPHAVGDSRLHIGVVDSRGLASWIVNSPFQVTVIAGPARGSQCIAQGAALHASIAGQIASFAVWIKDAFANDKRNAGSESLQISFQGPSPSTAVVPAASTGVTITYAGDGRFDVSYRLTVKGVYRLSVQVNGAQVVNGPFTMQTFPAEVVPSTTTIDLVSPLGTSLQAPVFIAGNAIATSITTRDAFNNTLDTGGNAFRLASTLAQPEMVATVPSSVIDMLNGQYSLTFTPLQQREYVLNARLMLAGGLNASYFKTPDLQDPVVLQQVDSNFDMNFGVQAPWHTDASSTFSIAWTGMLLPPYSEQFTFRIEAQGAVHLRIGEQDLLGSSWTMTDRTHEAGLFLVAHQLVPIRLEYSKPERFRNGSLQLFWRSLSQPEQIIPPANLFTAWRISNNVPPLQVIAAVADAPSFTATFADIGWMDRGYLIATAGQLFTFHVFARDRFANLRTSGSDQLYVVFPQMPVDVHPKIHVDDHNNGTYTIQFTPLRSGRFVMLVAAPPQDAAIPTHAGMDVMLEALQPYWLRQSPFTLEILAAAPTALASTIDGDGMYTAVAGTRAQFAITLRDELSNRVNSASIPQNAIDIRLQHIENRDMIVQCYVGDTLDGILPVEYVATLAGVYELQLRVLQSAWTTKISSLYVHPALATAATSTAAGDGLGPQVSTNEVTSFLVQLRDAFENPLETGGNDLIVTLRGPQVVHASIIDLANGWYRAEYTLPLPGAYEMLIALVNPIAEPGIMGAYVQPSQPTAVASPSSAMSAIALQWIDQQLDFNWTGNQTMRRFPRVQWRGFLKPNFTELYTLRLDACAGAVLSIDDVVVLDTLNGADAMTSVGASSDVLGSPVSCMTSVDAQVGLTAERLQRIAVDYRSPPSRDAARWLRLQWHSDRQPWQVIPTVALRVPDTEFLTPSYDIVAI